MQVGIHALLDVEVLLAQAHVFDRRPLLREGFAISAELGIPGVSLQQQEKGSSKLPGRIVPGRPEIFRKTVNGKSLGVDLLFADGGFPVGRHAPEDAAVSGIDKMVCQIRSGPPCSLQEFAPRPSPVCRREGPQNPAVQHGALVGGYIRIARAVDTAQETAPKRINRPFHPEGKYVFQQFPLRLATEATQYVVSHGCLFF